LVKDGVSVKEFGDAIDMFMCVVEVFVGGVPETLMPKEAFGACLDCEDRSIEF
tara:strand:- start:395 stop:553 length:159 start_codon:yes stop_codon:yes gene_type:complete